MNTTPTTSSSAVPVLHNAYLRVLQRVLARRGCELDASRYRWGEYVVGTSLASALADAEKTPAWPGLGLEVGADTDMLLHGRLGYAMAVSANLADALALMCRYSSLRAPSVQLKLDQSDGDETRVLIDLAALPPIARQLVGEALLVIIEQALRSLSSQTFSSARYRVPWPQPPWAADYARHLHGQVEFSADALTLTFPSMLLAAASLGSDPPACAAASAECERLLGDRGGNLADQVRARLLHWRGPWPDAARMATQLAMSRRQLFRELSSEGHSYRGLLDTLRCDQACAALRQSDASIESIAELLGYADGSNFSRCFRRWTGLTPRQWRLREKSATH